MGFTLGKLGNGSKPGVKQFELRREHTFNIIVHIYVYTVNVICYDALLLHTNWYDTLRYSNSSIIVRLLL